MDMKDSEIPFAHRHLFTLAAFRWRKKIIFTLFTLCFSPLTTNHNTLHYCKLWKYILKDNMQIKDKEWQLALSGPGVEGRDSDPTF